jgi:long-chain acyl-CoA synthetase
MTTPYDTRPWLRYYPQGVPAEAQFPDAPLTDVLDGSVRSYPRRPAVIFLGRKISYRTLAAQVDRFADALRALGVHKGDRVAMLLPNCPQQVISFFAILRRGAIVVQNNPLYTAAELHAQLADSGAKVAIVFDRAYETLADARQGTALQHVIVTSLTEYLPAGKRLALRLPLRRAREKRAELTSPLPEEGPEPLYFKELLASSRTRHSSVQIDPARDIAALQYTGGTTGTPKGAMLTHANLLANAYQTAAWDPDHVPGEDVTLAVLPMFHVFGLTLCLTTTMLIGGTIVLVPKFDLGLVLGEIRRWKPTVFPGVPPIYQQIAESPQARSARLDSVRTCVSGAMQLRRETVDAFRKATGARVVQGYGMTETAPVTMANPLNGNARHISVGVPLPGTVARIVSEADANQALPVGAAGELLVRGPQVFAGYWNQPKETAEVLSNGWLRTGDIAVMSPDGFFTLLDRKRDVIIVDGFNVYPSEVEEVLNSHPGVKESAVVGVTDPLRGETVTAYAVLVPGIAPGPAELIGHCAERLAGYKVPSVVRAREELPHNMLGKVLRRILRDEAMAAAAPRDPDLRLAGPAPPARAEPVEAPPGGEGERQRERDLEADVGQPDGRLMPPQRVGGRCRGPGCDERQVDGGGESTEAPAGGGQPRELLQGPAGDRYDAAREDDLRHREQHEERHGLLGCADHGGDQQAQAHRGHAEHGDADQQLGERGVRQERAVRWHRPPGQPDRNQDGDLHDADNAQHQQLRAQVRPAGQAGRAFSDIDRTFLDQFPDRAGGTGQAGADDDHQQNLHRAGIAGEAAAQP